MDAVKVYVFLGAPGSGRRELMLDVARQSLAGGSRGAVLLPDGEVPSAADAAFGDLSDTEVLRWKWSEGGEIDGAVPEDAGTVFFLTAGEIDPADQVEALIPWLDQSGADLGLIVTVVHCRLLFENEKLTAWFDACVHFSDMVLLNRREGLPNKWVRTFQDRFRRERYPCLFELVKGGRVKNPALILESEPRRLSLVFDDLGEADEEDEDLDAEGGGDPYLERMPSGHRVRPLPDIRPFLK